jgi:hypothetical protein
LNQEGKANLWILELQWESLLREAVQFIQISKTNYEKISVESWRNFVAALPGKKMISQKFSDFEKL